MTLGGKSVRKRQKEWERKKFHRSYPIPEIAGKWESATTTFPFAHDSIDRGQTGDLRYGRKGWTKAIVVNGVDKTRRSSTFYPILLLNVNPSHISLSRDFDILRKSTKISSYNGDGHRYQKISVILVQYPRYSFDIFTFITVVNT